MRDGACMVTTPLLADGTGVGAPYTQSRPLMKFFVSAASGVPALGDQL